MKIFNKLGNVISLPVTAPVKAIRGQITTYAEKVIQGQIRHLLTVAAGALLSQGYLGGSDTEAFVGAIMAVVVMLMSAAEKKYGVKE